MRVAVFGGTGQVGSQVCKALIACGCGVTSVSRSGVEPSRFQGEQWSSQVSWVRADAAVEGAAAAALAGGVESVVSCIGSGDLFKASSEGWAVTGYKWSESSLKLYAENYEPNMQVVAAAKEAGAERFVYVGAGSDVEQGFGGPNPGLYTGKRSAALYANETFGQRFTYFGPIAVVDSKDDFKMKTASSGLFGGLRAINNAIGELRTFGPDFANKARLTPPVLATDLALAIAACATAKLEVEPSVRSAGMTTLHMVLERDQYEIFDTLRHVDGTEAIEALARRAEAAGLST